MSDLSSNSLLSDTDLRALVQAYARKPPAVFAEQVFMCLQELVEKRGVVADLNALNIELGRANAEEVSRLQRQVDELSIHAEKWVKRALDRNAPASNSLVDRAWLLETNWGPHIHYFGPQGGVRSRGGGHIGTEPHEFTRDINRATLFRTKGDAEQFLQWMQANIRHSWLGWKVTEHEWVAPRASHEPPVVCGPELALAMDKLGAIVNGQSERITPIEANALLINWRQLQSDARAAQPPTEPLCPRPFNGRPDGFTMAQCILAGECGCTAAACEARKSQPPAEPHVIKQIEHALQDNPTGITREMADYIRGCISDYRHAETKEDAQ